METKKRALGMGLEQLFNNEKLDMGEIEKHIYESTSSEDIIEINLNDLRANPYQPRKNFEEKSLRELADSIKEHGVIQPIIVKKSVKGYEIIAGERRFRASKLAGLTTIPAIVREFTDNQMMEIALLENLQREDLNSIEEALAYKAIIDSLGITQDELSKRLGKSRSHITNILGLLRLPESIQDLVVTNKLSMGHARVLSKFDDTEKQEHFAFKVINEGLSVRDLERETTLSTNVSVDKKNRKIDNTDFRYAEDILSDYLDAKIKIKSGKLEISFVSVADLNRIIELIKE